MRAELVGPSGGTQHAQHGPSGTNQGRGRAESATHRTRARRCHPSRAFSEKGADAAGAREVTPSWVRRQGTGTLPDPSRGNHSPDSHAELLKTSQHDAGVARTVSAANEASQRAQGAKACKPPSTEKHLGRETSCSTLRLLCPMGSSGVRATLPGCRRSSQPEAVPAALCQYYPSGGGSGSGTT